MPGANNRIKSLLAYLGLADDKLISQPELLGICDLVIDSRQSNSKTIFVAVFGSDTQGHDYLVQVAKRGCKLALIETNNKDHDKQLSILNFENDLTLVSISIFALKGKLGALAEAFYFNRTSNESRTIMPSITAITGTNGKTSIASIYAQLASLCDMRAASIGTLGVNMFIKANGQKVADTINTTPDTLSIFSMLSKLSQANCKTVAIEASSHGLDQNRMQGLAISCAIFSNLTQDHLDYHVDMTSYAAAKRKLLDASNLQYVVLNADDVESLAWFDSADSRYNVFWYSSSLLHPHQQGCWAENIVFSNTGIAFTLCLNYQQELKRKEVHCRLIGSFNVANVLAAFTALLVQGFDFETLCDALSSISGVPGRMELFTSKSEYLIRHQNESKGASILVDYAHTPDALKQALLSARAHTKGELSCVFGCGGNRDHSKRAQMGEIASKYADSIVLTQDNSRNEAPLNIISDIKKGISSNIKTHRVSVELDRKKAITKAWQESANDDMILVAGKGHEDYIEIKNERIAYNEREFVAELLCTDLLHENTPIHKSTRTSV